MKKLSLIIACVLLLQSALFAQHTFYQQPSGQSLRTQMGVVLSVSSQDGSQLEGKGLGPGIEFFIRKNTASPFFYSFGASVLTLNDDYFKMKETMSIMLCYLTSIWI